MRPLSLLRQRTPSPRGLALEWASRLRKSRWARAGCRSGRSQNRFSESLRARGTFGTIVLRRRGSWMESSTWPIDVQRLSTQLQVKRKWSPLLALRVAVRVTRVMGATIVAQATRDSGWKLRRSRRKGWPGPRCLWCRGRVAWSRKSFRSAGSPRRVTA